MSRHANRNQCWKLWRIAVFGTFAACLLIAATAQATDEQAIRKALEKPVGCNFIEQPLSKVISWFGGEMHVEIKLDGKKLDDAGITLDVPMTFSCGSISARAALEHILRDLDLTWIIRDEMLVITTNDEANSIFETKVYAVQDILTPKSSYRFEGMYVPGVNSGEFPQNIRSAPMVGAGMGEMGGGTGGGSGGMGMFAVSDSQESAEASGSSTSGNAAAEPTKQKKSAGSSAGQSQGQPGRAGQTSGMNINDLVDVIEYIKPTTWVTAGGMGSIEAIGGTLVVTQTASVHAEIEKFLENLRAASPGSRVVSIRATWLLLNLQQLNELSHRNKAAEKVGIDRKALEEMAGKTQGYVGVITCFSGQTVHIASGRTRSAIISAIPVVGGGGEEPGYQPVNSFPQSGVMLQVTPQLLPNTQAVLLDLCSCVTRLEEPAETIRFLAGESTATKKSGDDNASAACARGLTLDRLNIGVEQLATTLKAPLDEPVLVGGLARQPATSEQHSAADTQQLYLFIEANASR